MSEIVIRRAVEADVASIAAVKVTGWRTTYGDLIERDVLAPFLDLATQAVAFADLIEDQQTVVLVADVDGDLVGFGVGEFTTGYVDSLHVLPGQRSSGVGRLLLGRLAEALIESGAGEVSLHVVSGNVAARRFYERLGGEMVGLAPAAWADSVEEAHYRWTDPALLVRRSRH